ncbi:hypothetical protein JQN63_11400 [Delftia lacustris]|uniref:hypothetical protein n=1 Tax=Delftia lacustris TaxID=558537 RepID=UPI00193C1529|nr:hypothetical protein [Delftia lacustris]QRI92518.1 hypothetical protein JQN63_11400 [Delftia lacustris]
MPMTPEQLLESAFAGQLDLDADATKTAEASNAASTATPQPPPLALSKLLQRLLAPAAAPAVAATPAPAPAAGAAPAQDDEPAGAPIASKSGSYTIPFEKLAQARTERDQFKARGDSLESENATLKAQIDQLTRSQQTNLAQAQADASAREQAGAAPTSADKNLAIAQAAASQGVDMALFGDFSEEGIAKGVAALVDQRAAALVDARLAQAMQPLQQREQVSARQAHDNAIYAAHADADEIADSAEFKQWVDAQPAFARAAVANVLQNGSAAEIVEVFSTFKGAKPAAPANAVDAAVAKAKADAVQAVPVSLSELTGAAAGASEAERAQALANNPAALLNVMSGMSSAKIDALMNSLA